MARYSVSVNKAGVNTAGTIYVNLWAPTNGAILREVGISIATAPSTAPDFYVVRSTARATQSTSANGTAMSPWPAGTSGSAVDSAWSSGTPTVGAATAAIRRLAMPVTAGGGVIWGFERGDFVIPGGAGIAIVNANASGSTLGAFNFYFDWIE